MKERMHVEVFHSYEELSRRAADLVSEVIQQKPDCVLGLATGSSPLGLYHELIHRYEEGSLDFSKVQSFNLDEYFPIDPSNPQSYRYFMNENLFRHINIPLENTHVPHGNDEDIEAVCTAYENMIQASPGIDIQVLGIGGNGHIAFNEPADAFASRTHQVDLEESTIQANARFFASEDDVPRKAITMGIGTIMKARRILLIANGKKKTQAVKACVEGPITPACPASVLQLHPDVFILAHKEAAALLK